MRRHVAYALLALLVLPVACKTPGRGMKAPEPPKVVVLPPESGGGDVTSRPTETPKTPVVVVDDRCGPQPPPKQVERLVRQEHPGGAARDFSYSKLERWRVLSGHEVWGWRVVVDITRETAARQKETSRHAYLIRKEPQGFAIVAAADGQPESEIFAWILREPDQEAKRQAEREELQRLRQAWARAREVPTMDELVAANFGPAPTRYRRPIQDHLQNVLSIPKSAKLRLQQPIKTWARRVGSGDTEFGWRVTATVIGEPDAEGNRMKRYDFMFRNGKIISTTRLGKGFRLVVPGEPPEPPPEPGAGDASNPPR
jgi:hypothetical protein